jgi:hypothetical protein
VAFLLQFITSFTSGVFIRPLWSVPGDIAESMLLIAERAGLVRAGILLDMLTAMGILFLGAVLYLTLRKGHELIALVAMGLYFLEAALLAASRGQAFSLLRLSQEYVAGGATAMLTMGTLAFESMEFVGSTLHMLAFCLGAILFYTLLYRSSAVPRWLSLWGLIAVFPMLVGTISQVFGYELPFVFYVPYVPFELVIGVWILVKGIPGRSRNQKGASA